MDNKPNAFFLPFNYSISSGTGPLDPENSFSTWHITNIPLEIMGEKILNCYRFFSIWYLGLFGLSELSCLKVTFCLPSKHYFAFDIFNINFIVIILSNLEFFLNKRGREETGVGSEN